ncbi:MAG TPA: 2-dehydropantoate 2-reductase [Candidatus Dormibacteraeota bacterium]|nr:2-dehydropantoate 2-reductase [Candidatus Dormibacteraeota bacterium]
MPDQMRFAVLGPGGVGGLLAALLARSGDEVVVLAGESTASAIANGGIRVESRRFGDFTAPVRVATELSVPVDAVFVTVKATQLGDAVQRVPPAALGDGLLIPLLNGLDHVAFLRRSYQKDAVVAATIRIETARIAPGLIRHTSPFAAIDVGARAAAVADRLRATGLDVRVRDDETAMLWDKYAILAPLALLTTHAAANAGVVRTRRRDDLEALVREFASVAQGEGVAIDPAKILGFVDAVPEAMETSMQRDQAAGRQLELDALGGALLRRAAAAGVEVPVTRRLVEEIAARSPAPSTSS